MLSLGVDCVSVSQWEDSCKQVFGFPFKYVVGKGFWEPSRDSAAVTAYNFRTISLSVLWVERFLSPPISKQIK